MTKLTPESALQILEYLREENVITDEQISKATTTNPSEILTTAAHYMHLIMCFEVNEECVCGFNKEADLFGEDWSRPAHVRWLAKTDKFVDNLSITQTEFMTEINAFNNIFQDMKKVSPAVWWMLKYYWTKVLEKGESDVKEQ